MECKNSLTGKHERPEQIGKNKGKRCCKYCSKLLTDEEIKEIEEVE